MNQNPVSSFLKTANLFVGAAFLLRLMLGIGAVFLIGFLVAITIDAALALPVWARVAVDCVALVGAVFAIAKLVRVLKQNRFDPRRTARNVEEQLELDDNAFINAVDLENADPQFASRELVDETIRSGEEYARRISPSDAMRLGPVFKAAGLTLLAFGLLTVSYFALPNVFDRVVPRYLDPFGDHPAFTTLEFDIATEPKTIYEGDPVKINLNIRGAYLPDQANIVFLPTENDDGDDASPTSRSADAEANIGVPMVGLGDSKYTFSIGSASNSRRFYVDTPHGRSDPFDLEVLNLPRFEKIVLELVYPKYTNFESRKSLLDNRGIRAIVGTHLTIRCTSNVALDTGNFEISNRKTDDEPRRTISANELTIDPNDDRSVIGTILLQQGNQFEINLTGTNGAKTQSPLTGRLTIAADRLPKVAIISPEPHVIAVENWKVPITVQATDDVALKRLDLLPAINGFGPYPRPLDFDEAESDSVVSAEYEFDLAKLGARAGDLITYFATATDHHPDGDHFAKTDTHVIQVISVADYKDLARRNYRMDDVLAEIDEIKNEMDQLQKQRDEILDELKELQEKVANGEELNQADMNKMAELTRELDDLARDAAALADQMEERSEQTSIYDFEDTYKERLKKMAEQLREQTENADELTKQLNEFDNNPSEENRQLLKEAMKKFEKSNEPFSEQNKQDQQELEDDLNKLANAEKMMEQVGRMKNVIEQQRMIADQMAEFRNVEKLDEAQQQRLKELAKQQDLLREELQDTMEKMEVAAEKSEEDFPKAADSVQQMLEKLEQSGVLDDQQEAAEKGHDGDSKKAHERAEEAAKKLEAMQCDCDSQGMGEEMADGDGPIAIPKNQMGRSLEQLQGSLQIPGMKPGAKPGQQGRGGRGSMAQARIFGPHLPSNSRSQMRSGGRQANQKGKGFAPNALVDSQAAENLTPDQRSMMNANGSLLDGVPSNYMDHAKAYLKRISETDEAPNFAETPDSKTDSQPAQ